MSSLRMPSGGSHPLRSTVSALALVAALALTGCSQGAADTGSTTGATFESVAEAGAFPVTVEHALGQTKIDTEPERVVVIGWTTPDVVVALGRVPVAVGFNAYGADAEGYFPWFREAVEELGGEMPMALPSLERGEIDFEELLSTEPDLILATYSGISEEDYDRLSDIAPTVAYPEQAWATPLGDNIEIVGEALGVPQRAADLQAGLDDMIVSVAEEHPEFDGVTFAYGTVPMDDGTLLLNGPTDPRVQLIEQLGMSLVPGVAGLGEESSSFNVSLEELSGLSPQLYVTNVDGDAEWKRALTNSSVFADWRPIAGGDVVVTNDVAQTMSLSAPSPLSIPWGLDHLVGSLAEAVANLE
ncbi:ABC transporter substrate-binding protein [Microbacterium sp. NPDC090281]|uniref:ABC transporter substrate-binding protein n=1 Tax=Microbacterium sp. NPDC090281 TaxID=3364208 RepID=UPI003816EB65